MASGRRGVDLKGGKLHPASPVPHHLLCVKVKVFFSAISRRLSTYLVKNNNIKTSVQKCGILGIPGCMEQNGVVTQLIREARENKGVEARPAECIQLRPPREVQSLGLPARHSPHDPVVPPHLHLPMEKRSTITSKDGLGYQGA